MIADPESDEFDLIDLLYDLNQTMFVIIGIISLHIHSLLIDCLHDLALAKNIIDLFKILMV